MKLNINEEQFKTLSIIFHSDRKSKVLVVGRVGSGKTFLIENLKEMFKDRNIEFYDSDHGGEFDKGFLEEGKRAVASTQRLEWAASCLNMESEELLKIIDYVVFIQCQGDVTVVPSSLWDPAIEMN